MKKDNCYILKQNIYVITNRSIYNYKNTTLTTGVQTIVFFPTPCRYLFAQGNVKYLSAQHLYYNIDCQGYSSFECQCHCNVRE